MSFQIKFGYNDNNNNNCYYYSQIDFKLNLSCPIFFKFKISILKIFPIKMFTGDLVQLFNVELFVNVNVIIRMCQL